MAGVSASVYARAALGRGWTFYDSLMGGLIAKYDHADLLASVGQEAWLLNDGRERFFARFELLQRTPRQLSISPRADFDSGRWVANATVGYGHAFYQFEGGELLVGGSASKVFLPDEFRAAYGGEPWSGRIFLQLNGMRMWHD
jgi:hypothetical protein